MTKIGFAWLPRSAAEGVAVAHAVEAGGFWGLGISDSPVLYAEMYPVISACLERTERITLGTNVTNPVTRHWTIHAASGRAYSELYPGRFYLSMASGDGAVHSIGRRPATLAQLEADLHSIRGATPDDVLISVAASGPRAAAAGGRSADAVTFGIGTDPTAVRNFVAIARSAREAAGETKPLETWGHVPTLIVERDGDVAAARAACVPIAVAYAQFAFAASLEDKHVPADFHAPLRERLDRYRFEFHATLGEDNPNARLFDDRPDILDYLIDRMILVGTRDQCAERLTNFIEESGVDGVHLPVIVPEPVAVVNRAAEAFAHLI